MNLGTLTDSLLDIIEGFPESPALVKPDCTWTYQELERSIRIVQQQLRERALKPQSVIGLLIQDPFWLAASIWAVIRERLVYVVLDGTYPLERLSYLLNDCQAAILMFDVESSTMAMELISNLPSHLLDFSTLPLSKENANLYTCQPEDLVCIFYTSGSTGKPKGVMHNHATILHEVRVHTATLTITHRDRFSALYSLATAGSNRDFYASLLNGASWNFFPFRQCGLTALQEWIESRQLTILHSIPLLFRELIAANSGDSFQSIRVLFLAGDRVLPDHIRLFRQNFPKTAQFYTGIGASEASSIYTHWFVEWDDPLDYSLLPSGYPLPEKEVFLVNERREPIPEKEVGEIAVCSDYLSPGYFGLPELTKQVFAERENGKRVYFTGDNGRFDEQQRLVFLGRKDHQVKINGFRIELGEIEAVLTQHLLIQSAVVVARDNPFADKQLVAYVVIKNGENLTNPSSLEEQLRQFLREKLPEYMIPVAYVLLDTLPLTPNGKVDRQQLPEPDWIARKQDEFYISPRNENEHKLTQIWENILGFHSISIKDNFFNLGGNSLQALKLLSQIEKTWQQKFPLSVIYQFPTIEEFVKVLVQPELHFDYYSLIPLQPKGKNSPLFGIHNNHYKLLIEYLGNDQPVYFLNYGLAAQTSDSDRKVTFPKRIEDLAAHYRQEIQKLHPQGPYWLMGVSFGGLVAYEIAQQLILEDQKVELLILFDTRLKVNKKKLSLKQRMNRLINLNFSQFKEKVKLQINHTLWQLKATISKSSKNSTPYQAYQAKPYEGNVIFFKAMKTQFSLSYEIDPPEQEWKNWIKGRLDIYEIPGDHLGILTESHNARMMAEILKSIIKEI